MRIVTWNINSIRLRMNLLARLAEESTADIICLQETKVMDSQFPLKDVQALGYQHVIFRGEKSYNGVAILSKVPLREVQKIDIANSNDARHISAILPDNTELHNFYIPAGGDEPDTKINPKYKFKLEFVEYMQKWFSENRTSSDPVIILGDFNIAPMEHDVWSHKQLRNVVSHTEPEITRLNALQSDLQWIDTGRHFYDSAHKLYSWWSYRNKDWKKSNRGRRLDHIWATPALRNRVKSYSFMQDARDWPRPSDHIPIMIDL